MRIRFVGAVVLAFFTAAAASIACNLTSAVSPKKEIVQPAPITAPIIAPTVLIPPTVALPTQTAAVVHIAMPPSSSSTGQFVYDVISEDTAPEGRAPYGDSYDINRLERPFTQGMSYLRDLDIWTFAVTSDTTWWYVSIRLIGQDPAGTLNPNYGVELDKDRDGFGDFLIWAQAPLTQEWQTSPVQIFQDSNHDTGGASGEKSDAPFTADGYDKRIFNGGVGDADPDLAWARLVPGTQPQVQFAFKKAWSGGVFMLGVIADAGLRDPAKLDYVDRFTLIEAGSPIRENSNYPLKALYAIDNSCREAYGFDATGYEPQLCPRPEPTKKPKPPTEEPSGEPPPVECPGHPNPGNCPYGWSGEPYCYCTPG